MDVFDFSIHECLPWFDDLDLALALRQALEIALKQGRFWMDAAEKSGALAH